MNPRVQGKIEQFKKMAAIQNAGNKSASARKTTKPDGLSMAIHSKKDADTFMSELRAITKRAR
jgi:hypothetical protein